MNKEDYFKYYIQGSDHYLIPKNVFIELFNEMENWREESKELNQKYLNAVADYETTMSELQELKLELSGYRQAILKDKEMLGLKEENDKLKKQIAILDKTNIQLISKLDRYDAIVDERDELKKQQVIY